MSTIDNLLPSSAVRILVWGLLHSLWQAPLISLIAAGLLRRLSARRHNARYAITLASFAAVVLLLMVNWTVLAGVQQWNAKAASAPQAAPLSIMPTKQHAALRLVAHHSSATVQRPPSANSSMNHAAPPSLDWTTALAVLWLLGMLVMLTRTGWHLATARRLMWWPSLPDEYAVIGQVTRLADRMHLRRSVHVILTDRLIMPAVTGIIRPVLLLPLTIVTGLGTDELAVVIAHELAHVRRYDLLVSLLQRIVEAALFFNPAIWWLSKQIDHEREACCDAIAADITGSRLTVAETLAKAGALSREPLRPASFPASTEARPGALPNAALGLMGKGEKSLFTRVRRLLQPDDRLPVRLPWPTFAFTVATTLAVLMALGYTAAITGKAVARMLTPKEQIQQVEKVQKEYEATVVMNPDAPKNRVTLKGRVRTWDGGPIPRRHYVTARVIYQTGRSSTAAGIGIRVHRDGRFERAVPCGRISLAVGLEGYAPAMITNRRAKPGGTITGLDFVLHKGFKTEVRLVDPTGNPIAEAHLTCQQIMAGMWLGKQTRTTDARGVAILKHLADHPVRLQARTAGYQFDARSFDVGPNHTVTWTLHPAQVVHCRLLDKATGKPIAHATIYIANRAGFEPEFRDIRDGHYPPLTTSDQAGKFVLDTLRDDSIYALWIEAPHHGIHLVRNITTDQPNLLLRIGPPLSISGKVIGNMKQLKTRRGKPVVTGYNVVVFGDSSYSEALQAWVHVKDGVGYFTMTNLVPGPTGVSAGGITKRFHLSRSRNDLVLDLSKTQTRQTRKVIIHLIPPKGWPKPTGTIRTDDGGPSKGRGYKQRVSQVKAGTVTVDATVSANHPGYLVVSPVDLPGYMFAQRTPNVPSGQKPMVVNIPVRPAGSISGQLIGPGGKAARKPYATLITIKPPKGGASPNDVEQHFDAGNGKFMLSGVPLGGTYRVSLTDNDDTNDSIVFSQPISVDRQHPTPHVILRMPAGVTVEAEIRGPNGHPLTGVQARLEHSTPWSYGSEGAQHDADQKGVIRWHHVNNKLPGHYEIAIEPTRNLQGTQKPIDFAHLPITVQLKPGLTTTGIIIDAATNRPVANLNLELMPASSNHIAKFRDSIQTTTDDTGRFALHNLEPGKYRIFCPIVHATQSIITAGRKRQMVNVKAWPGYHLDLVSTGKRKQSGAVNRHGSP